MKRFRQRMILHLAFAFPGLPIHVVAGGLVVAHADDGDVVQGGVALPVCLSSSRCERVGVVTECWTP